MLLLGDIAGNFLKVISPICYRSAVVCHSVRLTATFVHCAQTAEDIDTISFAYDNPMSLLDLLKFGLHWSTPSSPNLPKVTPL